MEAYVKSVLLTLLGDIALNRQSFGVVPEPRLTPETLESEALEHAVLCIRRLLDDASQTINRKDRGRPRSPFFNFPVELFSQVVKIVLSDADRCHDAGYYGQLTELCLVNKSWADTIHSLPALWTRVEVESSQEFLKVVLSRSAEAPLDIKGYLSSPLVAGIIKSEAHRWRSLNIGVGDENIINSFLVRPAPRLQELDLSVPIGWVPPANLNVFEGTAPNLETAVLRGGFPWESPILSNLRKLSLWRIERGAPELHTLLDILDASPELNELDITLTPIQVSDSSRRVKLPKLRLFELMDLSPEIMTPILRSIDAPLSTKCNFITTLEGEENTNMEEWLIAVSERLILLAQRVRSGTSTLTLRMAYKNSRWNDTNDEEMVLQYEAEDCGPLSITVTADPMRLFDILNHLVAKIRPYTRFAAPVLRLVDMRIASPVGEDANLLCALHGNIPNAQQIALVHLCYQPMVDALRRIFPQASSGSSPLFSALTTLTVKQLSHEDWVLWLQDHRRRTEDGGVNPLPRNLTLRLEGGSIDSRGLEALQTLVLGTLSLDRVQLREKAQQSEDCGSEEDLVI